MERYGTLIGRLCLAAIFLLSGFGKITNFQGTQQFMASHGMPFAAFFLMGAILLELAGGLSLVTGYKTKIGAALLIIFMIPTTLIFHTNFADQVQFIMFMKNIAMTGGLLYIASYGAGGLSLDARNLRKAS